MAEELRQVGTPNASLRNSPICELEDEPEGLAAPEGTEPGATACFFNGEAFPNGTEVVSGDQVLRCDKGSWVALGPTDLKPD